MEPTAQALLVIGVGALVLLLVAKHVPEQEIAKPDNRAQRRRK